LPFPSRINPATPELERHLEHQAASLKLFDAQSLARWRRAGFHRLAGRMYPHATPSRLAAISEVVLWLFIVDDQFDPGMPGSEDSYCAELAQKAGAILAGHERADACQDPLLECASRFRTQISPMMSLRWWNRFATHLLQFLESVLREATVHAMGATPNRQTYLARRQFTSGWHVLAALLELEAELDLPPDDVLDSEQHTACCTAAADVACAINDLLSLGKELAAGEKHNLVLVLQREHGCSIAEAAEQTRAWIDARLNDYFAARTAFTSRHADVAVVDRYVQGLENLMRGSLDWSLESGRYRQFPPGIEIELHIGSVHS
jgi:hypothetical protein